MQDIDPNMEELFRKASEDYPLKTGEDNWDKIVPQLSSEIEQQKSTKKSVHKKYYFSILLLLLFMSLGIFFLNDDGNQNNVSKGKGSQHTIVQQPASVTRINSDQRKKILSGAATEETHTLPDSNQTVVIQNDHSTIRVTGSSTVKMEDKGRIEIGHKAKSKKAIKENVLTHAKARDVIPTDKKNNLNNLTSVHLQYIMNSPTKTNVFSIVPHGRLQQSISLSSDTVQEKTNAMISPRRWYYGLILGPGFNAVKGQGLKKTGFDIGLLGGFRLGAKLSVETALLFSQKYYTTSGEYFSMKEIGPMMPAGMQVMRVQGSSRVFEIPIHLHYDLINKNNRRVFSSTGFSSYIMTEESNKYFTSMNGIEEKLQGFYKPDRRYFIAAIDLGVGYEQSLGRKNVIRFQPYIQVPIKGIGIGNLPVTSTGLHIGISRSAH